MRMWGIATSSPDWPITGIVAREQLGWPLFLLSIAGMLSFALVGQERRFESHVQLDRRLLCDFFIIGVKAGAPRSLLGAGVHLFCRRVPLQRPLAEADAVGSARRPPWSSVAG